MIFLVENNSDISYLNVRMCGVCFQSQEGGAVMDAGSSTSPHQAPTAASYSSSSWAVTGDSNGRSHQPFPSRAHIILICSVALFCPQATRLARTVERKTITRRPRTLLSTTTGADCSCYMRVLYINDGARINENSSSSMSQAYGGQSTASAYMQSPSFYSSHQAQTASPYGMLSSSYTSVACKLNF